MESEPVVEVIRFAEIYPLFHIIALSVFILLTLTLFILGLKKSGLRFQWLLSSIAVWIGLFGGISFTFSRFKMWRDVYFMGNPRQDYWALDELGSYFRLGTYLSLALVGWSLAIVLRLIKEKNANQGMDFTGKTPVE